MKKHVILIAVACTLSALPLFGTFFQEVSTFFAKDLPTQFRNLIQIVPEGMANANPQIAEFNLPSGTQPLANGSIRFTGTKNAQLLVLKAIDDFFTVTHENQPGLYIVRRYLKHQDLNTLGLSGKMLELYRAYQRQPDNKIPAQYRKFHIASYNDPKFLQEDRGRVFSGELEHVDVFYIINGK